MLVSAHEDAKMTQGRHSEPDSVKEAKGASSQNKKRAAVRDAAASKSGAPAELKGDALVIWNTLAPDLRALNFLRDIDRMPFMRYCEHMAHWIKLTKNIAEKGESYETDSNHGSMLRINPSFLVRERVERHLIALEDRFGMNTAYRQQILQRMAGLTALPPGGMFDTQNKTDEPDNENHDEQLPSAVGLLTTASNAHH